MTTSNCMTCIYGGSWCDDHNETGYCYMFREEPEGVCAKWAMSIRDSQAAPSTSRAAQGVNAELVEAFGKLYRKYCGLLESGRDRIIELGGTCDTVETMEMSDPGLRDARTALANAKAVQRSAPSTSPSQYGSVELQGLILSKLADEGL